MMSRVLVLLGVLIAVATVGLAQAPPKDLKQVGDHWTAWDPPASIEEGAEVHIIESGDTLWDLAERFYGNPYLWPQLWERNQYILDAHWIYPGDPLVLGFEVEQAEELEGDESLVAEGQEEEAEGLFGFGRSSFVQLGTPDDIYCSGYVGDVNEEFAYRVSGSEYDALSPKLTKSPSGDYRARFGLRGAVKLGLVPGDIAYIDGGRATGLAPGDTLTAIKPGRRVEDPVNGGTYGRFYDYIGRVRVLSVQEESSIVEVSQACDPILVGMSLKPFRPEPVPSERRTPLRPLNLPASAAELEDAPIIVYGRDGIVALGQDHVVFVNLGESDDVIPGDQYTIYRLNTKGNPPVILGELAILSVHSRTSVAKITESRFPIYAGDLLQIK